VIDSPGVLPQAAWQLDPDPQIASDEVRVRVDRLNLDAASYRQIRETYAGDPDKIRAAVLEIIATRGKMQNPVTGSGGMLTGTVEEAGPDSPLGLKPGQRIATLVSLTLTPLAITDSLYRWDGRSEQVPCEGHAILFARSIAAVLPDDLPVPLSLAVLDVCGAPALTRRVVQASRAPGVRKTSGPVVLILGAAGKSGSLSAAAARQAGAAKIIGVVPTEAEAALLREIGDQGTDASASAGPSDAASSEPSTTGPDAGAAGVTTASEKQQSQSRRASHLPAPESGSTSHLPAPESGRPPLVDEIVIADARDPVGLAERVSAAGGPADVTVVCVDVPGCEGGAILCTTQGGTVVFFSMATSFSSAALGAEGLAADVTMLVGNGYVPGHADLALGLIRTTPGLRALFEQRLSGQRLSGQGWSGRGWSGRGLSGRGLSGRGLSGRGWSGRGVRYEGEQP
jgi:L-erythro-3,5-diaminohexanoate dehydrogenase